MNFADRGDATGHGAFLPWPSKEGYIHPNGRDWRSYVKVRSIRLPASLGRSGSVFGKHTGKLILLLQFRCTTQK